MRRLGRLGCFVARFRAAGGLDAHSPAQVPASIVVSNFCTSNCSTNLFFFNHYVPASNLSSHWDEILGADRCPDPLSQLSRSLLLFQLSDTLPRHPSLEISIFLERRERVRRLGRLILSRLFMKFGASEGLGIGLR